jgi:oligopeptide transport system substrate-binding protein
MIMVTGELCYLPPPGLDFDPVKARAELALARQEMGAAFFDRFTYKFNSGTEAHKLIAEYLQQQWQQVLGLTVDLESQEWKTFLADTKNNQFDVARLGWIGNFPDPEGEFLPMYACASANNRTRYCNPEFDRLLEAARPIRDRKARLAVVRQAEQVMIEDAPTIPLYVYTQQVLQKPYVRDLAINFPDQPPLHEAWIDVDWRQHLAEPGR